MTHWRAFAGLLLLALGGCAMRPPVAAVHDDYDGPPNYSVSSSAQTSVRGLAEAYGLREVDGWPIDLLGIHCVMFELPAGADRDTVLTRLRHDSRVESAQPLQSFNVLGTQGANQEGGSSRVPANDSPNDGSTKAAMLTASLAAGNGNGNGNGKDPYRGLQRNLDTLGVTQAHNLSRGEGVRIAVIDTGVDSSHPDLAGRIIEEKNLVSDAEADYRQDRHGTAVAGIIAAVGNNNQGIVGIAPAARLYAFRACWPSAPNSTEAVCNTFTLAKALTAAINGQSKIINLSLSGPADPLLARIVNVGIRRGIVFVGAVAPAGAEGVFPTNIDGVISVDFSGSHNADGTVLYAPGTDVLTLVPNNRYDFMSGSSLAAATVSGGIALLLAREPKLRPHELQSLLARSTRPTAAGGNGSEASVNLCGALAMALRMGSCE
jgi:subtilisin family serine protease